MSLVDATQKENSSNSCVVTVSEPPNNPQETPRLLVAPIDWKQIWKDKGSGARKDGSMWEAIPPDSNYVCLGSIPQLGYNKPNIPNYRCVHSSLTEKVVTNSIAWSDKGSGADIDVTMFKLPNTGSYTTVPARMSKIEAYDLNANASDVPDPQIIDAIFSKRMDKIKTDMEAQIKAKKEQEQKEAFTHYLIVFLLFIGLLIFLVIIFRFIKGSKNKDSKIENNSHD